MKDCTSRKLDARVAPTAAWRARHLPHLAAAVRQQPGAAIAFTREPFPHPSGTWFWLVCRCGAKHLCAEEA